MAQHRTILGGERDSEVNPGAWCRKVHQQCLAAVHTRTRCADEVVFEIGSQLVVAPDGQGAYAPPRNDFANHGFARTNHPREMAGEDGKEILAARARETRRQRFHWIARTRLSHVTALY